jgi:ribonuclease D
MSAPEHLKTALQAADSALLLETPSQVARAAKAWRGCGILGLDTEFVRERTYHANLGLVQISDGQTVWLLDPLAEGALDALNALLINPGIQKIFHGPSEDLEVLQHAAGALPEPMIDTQVACALLGQSLQLGYHKAVHWLLDIEIDKEQTRSNWCARPLSKAQLHYAALDVCLLPMMWEILHSRLEQKNRLEWLSEDCQRQLQRARSEAPTSELWRRVRGAGRLDATSSAILQALVEWREGEARRRNLPRGFVITDPVLLTIADRKIQRPEDLERLNDLHRKTLQRHGARLCRLVEETRDSGHTLTPLASLTTAQQKLLKRMQALVQQAAKDLGVEPSLLAPKRDLEELILSAGGAAIPERLGGWRHDVLGRQLLQLMKDD